ncbi:hypothetical protein UA08_02507 [Talaromyces atroroseus]|uniref:Zn(2)-C6 fungal-type domain-containing protein n=1 Tax=Talaromyces atroroseus TaxID=1441469 RepID=A0A225ALU2_TALAT|nr:hypothetical protein UA08_02507 [Talaromyces atroroseus]OKL61870.1 hypothetical protein UA08_02507 [Talaromyces atroroseus]
MPSPPENYIAQLKGANTSTYADATASASASAVPEKRKRTKYAAKACIECKRRKVKCCGEQPCQRCRRRMMDCVFAPDDATDSRQIEKLLDQIQKMQTQIDTLTGTVESFNSTNPASSPPLSSAQKQTLQGTISSLQSKNLSSSSTTTTTTGENISYHGLTTSSFNFDIAQQTLRSRGITEAGKSASDSDDEEEEDNGPSPMPAPSLSPRRDRHHHRRSSIDPLWGINRDEAIRLFRIYDEEMGIMYPILDPETIINQINTLYTHLRPFSEAAAAQTSKQEQQQQPLSDEDINILKLVFACALTAEANGKSELAMSIFRGVRDVASHLVWKRPSIKRLVIITLVSIYYFQTDEESIAWRTVGIAQRLCLELGLHRSETYPQHAIISYGKEEKVWRFITSSSHSNHHARKEKMAYLDWQVTQWYNSIPEFLKLPHSNTPASNSTNSSNKIQHDQHPQQDSIRSIWRLKALLYLRASLMKILIYRPILHTPALVAQSPVEASTVVDIARDMIRFITHLNQSTDIYQLQQVAFNWFLISALAVLFLAVAHAPAQFTSQCKDEFYMALGLVEDFSIHSYISQRLWKSIKGLRRLAPQIGLWSQNQQQQQYQQHVSPATQPAKDENSHSPSLISTQLTGPKTGIKIGVEGNNAIPTQPQPQPETKPEQTSMLKKQEESAIPDFASPNDFLLTDGTQVSRELMDWFEAIGAPNPAINTNMGDATTAALDAQAGGYTNMMTTATTTIDPWPVSDDFMYGYGSELAGVLRGCF